MNKKSIDDIYSLIGLSDFSVIAYDSKSEYVMKSFISNINYHRLKNIDVNFNIFKYIRDIKLDQVLSNSNSILNDSFFILDINDIEFGDSSDFLKKSKILQDLCMSFRIYSINFGIKIILTTQIINKLGKYPNFKMGNSPLYMCDLALMVKDEKIKVFKNRFGDSYELDLDFDILNKNAYIC